MKNVGERDAGKNNASSISEEIVKPPTYDVSESPAGTSASTTVPNSLDCLITRILRTAKSGSNITDN